MSRALRGALGPLFDQFHHDMIEGDPSIRRDVFWLGHRFRIEDWCTQAEVPLKIVAARLATGLSFADAILRPLDGDWKLTHGQQKLKNKLDHVSGRLTAEVPNP